MEAQGYSRERYEARRMIFDVGDEAHSKTYLSKEVIDRYLEAVDLYAKGLEKVEQGDLRNADNMFRTTQRKLLAVRSQLRQQSDSDASEVRREQGYYRGTSLVLMAVAVLMFFAGIYIASVGIKYETTVMSFAILVFVIGATLTFRQTNIQRRYIYYMWIGGLIIIGALNGVSVIGTAVKP
jgi:hypothetical protein